jgi:hypothetical protein
LSKTDFFVTKGNELRFNLTLAGICPSDIVATQKRLITGAVFRVYEPHAYAEAWRNKWRFLQQLADISGSVVNAQKIGLLPTILVNENG